MWRMAPFPAMQQLCRTYILKLFIHQMKMEKNYPPQTWDCRSLKISDNASISILTYKTLNHHFWKELKKEKWTASSEAKGGAPMVLFCRYLQNVFWYFEFWIKFWMLNLRNTICRLKFDGSRLLIYLNKCTWNVLEITCNVKSKHLESCGIGGRDEFELCDWLSSFT